MSDHFLVVIPADPSAPLPEDGGDAICTALRDFAGSDECRVKSYDDRVQFIDAGENFESVSCPACGVTLDQDWWSGQMDHCWNSEERRFNLHAHALPCCGASKDLSELVYDGPQGFATWFVSARNEGRGPLTKAEVAHLETIAGQKLTAIAQMY